MENFSPEQKPNVPREHTMRENISRLIDAESAVRDYFKSYKLSPDEVEKMIGQVKSLEIGSEVTLSDPSKKMTVRFERKSDHDFNIFVKRVE